MANADMSPLSRFPACPSAARDLRENNEISGKKKRSQAEACERPACKLSELDLHAPHDIPPVNFILGQPAAFLAAEKAQRLVGDVVPFEEHVHVIREFVARLEIELAALVEVEIL